MFLVGRLYCGEFYTLTMLILILVACLTLRGHEAGLLHEKIRAMELNQTGRHSLDNFQF